MEKRCSRKTGGFSLIEVLIVVAIIGIIAAVAIPSYTSYMEKARRADAASFLTEVASEQFRFFSEYNRYGTTMAELGYGNDAVENSKEGFYTVSITSNSDTNYLLTAAPVAGGPQANDTECGSFTLSSSNQKGVTGTASAAECW